MNRKGFTLIELIIVIVIIGILAAIALPQFLDQAHGADFQPVLATDASITSVAKQLKAEDSLQVKVMTYLASWTHDSMDPHIDRAKVIKIQLMDQGVANERINMIYANKDALASSPVIDGKPAPVMPDNDGVYLLLY